MRSPKFLSNLSALLLGCSGMLFAPRPAQAMDQVSVDDLQAAMHTLSFLESLPKAGSIVVGVLYSSDTPEAEAIAEATAQLIATLHGPNSRTLQPLVLSTNALRQFQGHLDVLWLTTGVCKHAPLIADNADTQCCVIAVR